MQAAAQAIVLSQRRLSCAVCVESWLLSVCTLYLNMLQVFVRVVGHGFEATGIVASWSFPFPSHIEHELLAACPHVNTSTIGESHEQFLSSRV
jgi:hypothetical protein